MDGRVGSLRSSDFFCAPLHCHVIRALASRRRMRVHARHRYVIPTPVIDHFISDYDRNTQYTGFPSLGCEWQKLENASMRKSLGMGDKQKGVLIRRLEPLSAAPKFLHRLDVLMAFDGVEIANDGTVPFRTGERISFNYLVSKRYVGDIVSVRILRKGKAMTFQVPLVGVPRLVPVHIEGVPPSYFIVAGIVFTAVCVPYLKSEYGKDYDYDAPVRLLDKMLHEQVTVAGENVVVVSQVLAGTFAPPTGGVE